MSRLKMLICRLFHRKETRTFDFGRFDPYLPDIGLYRGCRKCDKWRLVSDYRIGKAACCSAHAGGDEECRD